MTSMDWTHGCEEQHILDQKACGAHQVSKWSNYLAKHPRADFRMKSDELKEESASTIGTARDIDGVWPGIEQAIANVSSGNPAAGYRQRRYKQDEHLDSIRSTDASWLEHWGHDTHPTGDN